MHSASLLSLEVSVTNWKVSGVTQLTSSKYDPTTCDTVLDKFTGCEVMLTVGKNVAERSVLTGRKHNL